tara:strand:- start:262 stop:774 length:513 start_codon:yes stop_codon:yes gene_type:complete
MSRGLTVSRMGRTNETAAKERKLMDRWAREGITDPVLLEEPTGSVLLQAPFMFGSLPGMPASIEHMRPSRSLPHLPLRHERLQRTLPRQEPSGFGIAAGGPPSPASPPLPALKGRQQWLKDQLRASADAADPLSFYIMRKHSRRFLPGSQYQLELAQTQTAASARLHQPR